MSKSFFGMVKKTGLLSLFRFFFKVPMKRNFLSAYLKEFYFIVIVLLVAELFKILIYAN